MGLHPVCIAQVQLPSPIHIKKYVLSHTGVGNLTFFYLLPYLTFTKLIEVVVPSISRRITDALVWNFTVSLGKAFLLRLIFDTLTGLLG